MKICKSCGGVIGKDCFNPQECEWISNNIEKNRVERKVNDRFIEGYVAGGDTTRLAIGVELQAKRAKIEDALKAARRRAVLGYRCEEIIDSLEKEIEYIFDGDKSR